METFERKISLKKGQFGLFDRKSIEILIVLTSLTIQAIN